MPSTTHFTNTLTTKPGTFHAVCRKGSWQPLADVLALPRSEQPDTVQSRWDSRLKCEVVVVPCTLDTTDRDVFEQHMATVHPGGHRWEPGGLAPTYGRTGPKNWTPRMAIPVKLWPATPPKGRAEGKALSKAATEQLAVCPRCGLQAEHDAFTVGADRLWWSEHLELCIGTVRA